MKLYVCGPMTGLPELNRDAFFIASKLLLDAGYDPVNPADHVDSADPGVSWADNMRRDIVDMLNCDGVALLSNWDMSRGARLEARIAGALGIPCQSVEMWIDRAKTESER